jgi:hypothetical protein
VIEGPQFPHAPRPRTNTGDLNQPLDERIFHFSPEVGRIIQPPGATAQITEKELLRFRSFGRGTLFIDSLDLPPSSEGAIAHIEKMSFRCWLEFREWEK